MDLTTSQIAQGVLAALLTGFSKTGVAGMGIVIVPLMANIFGPAASVGALLPMLLFADLFALLYYRRHAQWGVLLKLMPWALSGMALGYVALVKLTDEQHKHAMGSVLAIIILGLIVLKLVMDRFGSNLAECIPRQWWFSAFCGLLAGFLTTIGNMAGSIMSIYLLSMGLEKREFMGTGAWYYAVVNAMKMPLYAERHLITAQSLTFNLWVSPLIALGALAGALLFRRIPQKLFNDLILAVAGIAAVRMLWQT